MLFSVSIVGYIMAYSSFQDLQKRLFLILKIADHEECQETLAQWLSQLGDADKQALHNEVIRPLAEFAENMVYSGTPVTSLRNANPLYHFD